MRGQGRYVVAIDKGIGNGVACRKAAGHWNKVVDLEFAQCLRFDEVSEHQNSHPVNRVVFDMATGMERGLEVDSANGRGA